MNHLAHALIAEHTGTSIVGNLMGDFVKGPLEDGAWDAEILRGLRLHRRVDAWTDEHPLFHRSRMRLGPELRRWSGILVDLYWDHVLAREWDTLAGEPLGPFADRVTSELTAARPILPGRMLRFVEFMTASRLLEAYARTEGIRGALEGMSMRMRRGNPLAEAAVDLPALYPGLREDFLSFWEELLLWSAAIAVE